MDVTQWLQDLGLPYYAALFRAQAIDADVLPSLTDEKLGSCRRVDCDPLDLSYAGSSHCEYPFFPSAKTIRSFDAGVRALKAAIETKERRKLSIH